MRYVLLICNDEKSLAALSPEEAAASTAEYSAFAEALAAQGKLLGGERLRPTTDATTVQVRGGDVLVADGPFAETKEQIGGYFVVECDNLDEAVEVAAKLPAARNGGLVEVRPIWEM